MRKLLYQRQQSVVQTCQIVSLGSVANKVRQADNSRRISSVFRHQKRDIIVVIHGDDFTALGYDKDLDWYREQISSRMSTKVKGRLGSADNDLK